MNSLPQSVRRCLVESSRREIQRRVDPSAICRVPRVCSRTSPQRIGSHRRHRHVTVPIPDGVPSGYDVRRRVRARREIERDDQRIPSPARRSIKIVAREQHVVASGGVGIDSR